MTSEFIESSLEYSVVTLLGPRQSGKTTLARKTFPDKPYFLLETPDIRQAGSEVTKALFYRYGFSDIFIGHSQRGSGESRSITG